MLLQLIVIHYDEDESYIKNLLNVLKLQQWFDFRDLEVLIENDGDKVVYDKSLFENYPFKIRYHVNEWSGRSGVRQHGLNRATADYVMFCDCDDTFLRFDALATIKHALIKEKPDVLFTIFKTNFVDDNGLTKGFRDYYNENVWIHGKCFRTKFLKDNDISWNKSLNNFEDAYFVRLVDAFRPKKFGINLDLYAWKYRATSSTRGDGKTEMLDYLNCLNSQREAIKAYIELDKLKDAGVKLFITMYEVYFLITSIDSNIDLVREYTAHREQVEKEFIELYEKYKQYLDYVSPRLASTLYTALVKRFFEEKQVYLVPKDTLEQFIENLKQKYLK